MASSLAGIFFDALCTLGRPPRGFEARLDLVEVAFDWEDSRRHRTVDHRHRDLKAQMARQHTLFLQRPENEVGIDGVAREAEAPARIAEAHALDPVANLELPSVGIVVGVEPLHAVVRARVRENVELRMTREHLVVDAADPVAARATSPSGLALRKRPSGAPKVSHTSCGVSRGMLPTSNSCSLTDVTCFP